MTIAAWIAAGAVPALFAGGVFAMRRRRLVLDTPTSKVKGVFLGLNEVRGVARLDPPLTSRLAEVGCVWYRYEVEEQWRRTRTTVEDGKTRTHVETGWQTVDEAVETRPFDVVDATGALRVRPDGASIQATPVFSRTCGRSDPLYHGKGPAGAVADSTGRRRFTEEAIPVGCALYVLGPARLREDRVEPEIAEDDDVGPFVISTRGERGVVRRYAFAAVAALLLAVVAAGLVPLLAGWEEGDDLAHAWTRRGPVAIGAAGGVAALFLLTWLLLVYNGLVLVRNRVGRAWSLVAVQLQRRHALVPALTECARGYAQHEGELQELVTSARLGGAGPPPAGEEAPDATSVRAGTEAAQAQARAFEALVALAEGHPELRADTVFARLQDEIVDTEDRIALAREFFNDSVTIMRDRVRTFPGFLVARLGRFPTGELFAADGLERAVPRVEPVG